MLLADKNDERVRGDAGILAVNFAGIVRNDILKNFSGRKWTGSK